jgi:hypothetical protein
MEPTQLGIIIAGSVVALTIAAVTLRPKVHDPYTFRNSKGTNVYDPEEKIWQFFPNKGGRRSRKIR